MKRESRLYIGIATLLVLSLLGCRIPFGLSFHSGVGSLRVSVGDSSAQTRTVVPGTDTEIAEYLIDGAGPSGKTFSTTLAAPETIATIEDLLVGPWYIDVTAANAAGLGLYAGSAVGVVSDGTEVYVAVQLKPVDGLGELLISVQWDAFLADSPDVVGTILPHADGATATPLDFTIDAAASTASFLESLTAGYYTLSFELIDGVDSLWQFPTEAVRILAGEVTDLSVSITYDDVNISPVNIPGQMIWRFSAGVSFFSSIWSSPALAADGTIYIGSDNGVVYAVYPTGEERWSYDTGARVYSSPAVSSDGTVYVGSYDGNLYAFNADGTLQWAFPTGDWVRSSPSVASDGTVYFGSKDGNLYAVNPDGSAAWTVPFTTGGEVASSPAIASDGTIYVGSYDGNLYAVNPDGTEQWTFPTADWVHSSPAVGPDGTVYVGSYDGNLYAIDPETGLANWSYDTGDWVGSSPSLGEDGTVYIGSRSGALHAVEGTTGTQLWTFAAGVGGVYSSPAVGKDGVVYFGSYDRHVYAVGSDGVECWRFATGQGGIYSSPTVSLNGTVYFGARDGNLYAVGSSSLGPAPSAWPMFGRTESRTGQSY